jgi:hypothetical protein
LEAAVLLDAISSATGVPEKFEFHAYTADGGDPPRDARALQMIPDVCQSLFMDIFGRSMRNVLPTESPKPSLLEALHMFAGPTYTSKIFQPGGRLDRLLKKRASDDEVIKQFYLAALTRFPSPQEEIELLDFMRQRSSRREEALESLVWGIISSREFAYNH